MESDFMETLETVAIGLAIITPGIVAFVGYFRSKFKCITDLKKEFADFKDQYGDRQLRHSKAFIILANRIDDINEEQHGKKINLGPEIETILKDRHGNL
jgi:hypothetical protein